MHALLVELRDTLHRLGIVEQSVLLAVSGGADSVAMLRAMLKLQSACQLRLQVAHFNHRLRGDESDADARWVAELCTQLGVVGHLGSASQAETTRTTGSREGDARQLRYQFLEQTAVANSCRVIAVAHTADDQAETVLHRILRGTGLTGLSGIPPIRTLGCGVNVVRPLLGIQRQDLHDWLREIGQEFRTDSSNTDRDFTRNRIRHDLLPLLESQFNPQVKNALCRLAEQAVQTQAIDDFIATNVLQSVTISQTETACVLDCQRLAECPTAIIRVCLRRVWVEMNWPQQKMSYQHYTRLQEAICTPTMRGLISLPRPVQAKIVRESRQRRLILQVPGDG